MAETINFELDANAIPFGTTGLEVPSYYAEYIRGAMVTPTVAKLALVENRFDVSADAVRTVHVLQLVVPTEQLRAWAAFFTEQADRVDRVTKQDEADAKASEPDVA